MAAEEQKEYCRFIDTTSGPCSKRATYGYYEDFPAACEEHGDGVSFTDFTERDWANVCDSYGYDPRDDIKKKRHEWSEFIAEPPSGPVIITYFIESIGHESFCSDNEVEYTRIDDTEDQPELDLKDFLSREGFYDKVISVDKKRLQWLIEDPDRPYQGSMMCGGHATYEIGDYSREASHNTKLLTISSIIPAE
jgi:hypothetical protein